MGPGTPYAISARFAFPDRPVIALIGDGVFQMNGMLELITVKRYWERFQSAPLVFCVFNNQDLNQVTWEQRAMAGDPKYPGSQWIPDVPYAEYAKLLGLRGIRCDSPEDIGTAWDEALSSNVPCVLEVVVDPEIPPVPPHIMTMQLKHAAKAVAKGDPETLGIAEKGVKQKAHEFTESIKSHLPGGHR
jgi:pyruvate dehydrogenase (quinone)